MKFDSRYIDERALFGGLPMTLNMVLGWPDEEDPHEPRKRAGWTLTEYQIRKVRESNARVMARHASDHSIVVSSPVVGGFVIPTHPES